MGTQFYCVITDRCAAAIYDQFPPSPQRLPRPGAGRWWRPDTPPPRGVSAAAGTWRQGTTF